MAGGALGAAAALPDAPAAPSLLTALVRKHVYVAAPYAHREDAAELARALRSAGVWVTSRWHDAATEPEASLVRERLAAISTENGADLMVSDAIIVLDRPGGRATYAEAGITGARGKPILWVTPRGKTPPCILGILQQRIDDGGITEIVGRLRGTPAAFAEGSPR
jgi:hypothetical protein